MRRASTKIDIPIIPIIHQLDDRERASSASFSTLEDRGKEIDININTTIGIVGDDKKKKMLSEKQQRKVAKKLHSINRYFAKLIPTNSSSNSNSNNVIHHPKSPLGSPLGRPLKLITAPPPPTDPSDSDVSTENTGKNSNVGRVLHYAASLGSLKTDLAKARVLLDENRARETREVTMAKGHMPSVPGWAELLLDYGHEYRLHNGNNHNNNVKHAHKAQNSRNSRKKTHKRNNDNQHVTTHLLHLSVAYCGCLQCLVDDVRSDDVPDSLGDLDRIPFDDIDVPVPDNKTPAVGAADDSDVFHDESLGVFSHEIRRISTSHPEDNNNIKMNIFPDGQKHDDVAGGCSMGAKCVVLQRKECIFENTDSLTNLYQAPPKNAVTVPLPNEAALRALCDSGDPATGKIPMHTVMELGLVRKGTASFTGQIASLKSTCCSVRPDEILRAAEALYSTANVNGNINGNGSGNSKKGKPCKFFLQGSLYRFGLDAGIFPVDPAATPTENTNGNINNHNHDHAIGNGQSAVAVVYRRQPFVILSGTICIPGKSMGEYIPSDLEVLLGFGEDNSGARDVHPDGSLGLPRNLCLKELLVHVPMHLRDDRWELILK